MRRTLLLVLGAAVLVPALPASADDPETRAWTTWHRRRALELTAENRLGESVEEWVAVANLKTSDPSCAVRAGIAAIEAGSLPGRYLQPADPLYKLAESFNVEATRRGGVHDPGRAYLLGRLRMVDQSWEKAFNLFEFARRRGYDPVKTDCWWFRAVVNHSTGLIDLGNLDDAVNMLRRALEEVPDHPERLAAYINLATAYRRRNEATLAEALLTKDVFPKWPRAAKAFDVLGQIYADQNRLEAAIEQHRKAMDIAQEWDEPPYSGQAVYAEALLHVGTLSLRALQLERAEEIAGQYLELKKDDVEGLYLLGSAQFTRGRNDGNQELMRQAAINLRKGARLSPDHEPVRTKLLEVDHQLGEEDEVVRVEAELREITRRAEAEKARKH